MKQNKNSEHSTQRRVQLSLTFDVKGRYVGTKCIQAAEDILYMPIRSHLSVIGSAPVC